MKFLTLAVALFISMGGVEAVTLAKKDDEDLDKNTPDRFKQNNDDIFMRSMYRTYASDIEKKDKETGEMVKTGELGVTRSSAY